ncbi:MAG: DUF3313 family protein [Gammaproteobacteria bacterium]
MNSTNDFRDTLVGIDYRKVVVTCALVGLLTMTAFAQEDEGISFDGLVPVENARVASAFIDPDADFSVYRRFAILDTFVAFKSNWQRDQNRDRRGSSRISVSDMERIKADVARIFKEVMIERMEADDGFEVVDFADYDVLLLRPAIIDLDVTAPDTLSAGRSQTYSASTGAATLYIELFDSVSGEIIGRAIDRQGARRGGGTVSWSNRVTNVAEARRVFGGWADLLRAFLEEHYVE